MSIKGIIREEMDDLDWIRDVPMRPMDLYIGKTFTMNKNRNTYLISHYTDDMFVTVILVESGEEYNISVKKCLELINADNEYSLKWFIQ